MKRTWTILIAVLSCLPRPYALADTYYDIQSSTSYVLTDYWCQDWQCEPCSDDQVFTVGYSAFYQGHSRGYADGQITILGTTIDGLSLPNSLLPGSSHFRIGGGFKHSWGPDACGCPISHPCGVAYEIGPLSGAWDGATDADGNFTYWVDFPAGDLEFHYNWCNSWLFIGAGCGIVGSIEYRLRLITPAPLRAHAFPAGTTSLFTFPGTAVGLEFVSGPGGVVSAINNPGYPPIEHPISMFARYWELHGNLTGPFEAAITITYDPAELPTQPGVYEEGDLVISCYDEDSAEWRRLPTALHPDSNSATATGVTKLGLFMLHVDPTSIPEVAGDQFEMALFQNSPNPFNPMTEIRFRLPHAGYTKLAVHDLSGRRVKTLHDGEADAGDQIALWDGRDEQDKVLGSGVYFVRLIFEGQTQTRKMTLLR